MKKLNIFLIKNNTNPVLNRFVLKLKDSQNLEKNFKRKQSILRLGEKKMHNKKICLENG